MNMRELIDLFEAPPKQGVTGQKLAQTSGGQFMNRADRTNQAKVDAALGGAVNPATGKPYVAGTAAANQALAKKFSQPAAVAAAPTPATNVAAPSADNEALKGQTIAKAMNPPAVAANPGTAAAGIAFNQAAGSSPGTATTSAVPADQALDAGEEIVSSPTDTQTAPYNGAAANAMASRSAPAAPEAPVETPAQTSDQTATAALNAQDSTPAADTRGAAAMASRSAPAAQELPANAFPNPNTNASPAQQNTAAPAQAGGYAQSATAATNNPAPKSDYQPVAGSSNLVSRTSDKIAADAKAGPGGQNPATKSYASFGDFASAVGNKVKGFFGGNQPAPDATAGTGPNLGTGTLGSTPNAQQPPAFVPSATTAGTPAAFGKVAEADAPATSAPQQTAPKTQKAPSMYDVDKANRKEIASQFDPKSTYQNPHDKDTKASAPGSKAVNTMADFEEDVDHALAEMMRLSGLTLSEKAPPGKKAERTVKHIKKGYAKDGKLTKKEKGIAYATAWKQHNKEKVNEGMDIMLDEDGHTLKHIVNRFKHETKNFMSTGFMAENLYDALFDYYLDRGDMPYGIAKAREGDPYQWVEEHFYADMGSEMSEGAVAEQTVDPLSELARLAGLREDGPGQFGMPGTTSTFTKDKTQSTGTNKSVEPMAQFVADLGMPELPGKAFSDKERQDYRKIMQGKKSGVDEDGPGSTMLNAPKKDTDSFMDKMKSVGKSVRQSIDRATLPKGMHADYDRIEAEKDARAAREPIATPTAAKASAFKDALGAASSQAQADDKLKENDELNHVRRIAGLQECGDMSMGHERMHQKDRLNVTTNMSSDGTKDVTINAQGDKADELLQMLKMAGMRAHDDHDHSSMSEPEVIMISSDDEEMMEADRVTDYSNTPEEEYQTVDSIMRQGNDLNREKRQYADKPKLGDNPMAESILDADLDAMLESILVRENDNPKIEKDEKTGRVRATYAPPEKEKVPDQSKLPLQNEPYHGPRSLKVDGEKTGTEKDVDEGWEDVKTGVSNFVGDLFNTDDSIRRRSGQFRDLEAMQQKYKPGTPEYDQLEMRKTKQKDRYYGDQGEVVGKDGEPIKVLPPDQWKGGK